MHTLERSFRDAALRAGNAAFCSFLSAIEEPIPECPECKEFMKRVDKREKDIVSLMGNGKLVRGYYECEHCGTHYIPRDNELDMIGTSFTPGTRRAVSLLACHDSFKWSSDTLSEIVGIYVSPKECQRIAEETGKSIEKAFVEKKEEVFTSAKPNRTGIPSRPIVKDIPIAYISYDGTGVPMMKQETEGKKGKQEDGSAKTREAKLGCIFTQTTLDEGGNPVRDPKSTLYFGAIETAEEFGERLFTNAACYGILERAQVIVIIGDGAKWIWNQAKLHFPDATYIVDLYHAKEHIHKLVNKLQLSNENQSKLLRYWVSLLEAGKALELSKRIKVYRGKNDKESEELQTEAGYFVENADRMKYDIYKEKGFFVGSGVIEAGCKTVIGKRLKQSGMFWSVRGANAIIALRCNELSSPKLRLSA